MACETRLVKVTLIVTVAFSYSYFAATRQKPFLRFVCGHLLAMFASDKFAKTPVSRVVVLCTDTLCHALFPADFADSAPRHRLLLEAGPVYGHTIPCLWDLFCVEHCTLVWAASLHWSICSDMRLMSNCSAQQHWAA